MSQQLWMVFVALKFGFPVNEVGVDPEGRAGVGGASPPPPYSMGHRLLVASEKMLKGLCANRNSKKKTGIDFYSGLRKNAQGGVQFEIPK